MSFRARLLVALLAAALLPLAALAVAVRREMARVVTTEQGARTAEAIAAIGAALRDDRERTAGRLRSLKGELAEDSRFRLAVSVGDARARAWLLDYAGSALRAAGLDFLQIQDAAGRVLSSGHFRNEYDRALPTPGSATGEASLFRVRTPTGVLLALGTSDSFTAGGATYTIAGGTALDSARLAGLSRAPGIEVLIILPGEAMPGGADSLGAVPLRYVDLAGAGAAAEPARLAIVARSSPLAELPRRIDRWFLGTIVVTLLLALGLALWLATRVSRPIRELSARTAALDLDRLDQDFASERTDELGDLSNLLDAMTRRLRTGAARLREAERRAAFGDLARQVNHDIRNGLAPMRHVVRHLGEVASEHPAELPAVFAERRATLESSIQYLEELARNYARLGPVPAPGATDLNVVVREVARALAGDGAQFDTQLADGIPPARADAVTLRRIVENLAVNAVESLPGGRGTVTLATRPGADPQHVRLVVSDTGSGMTRAELDRAFDDFHTTKPTGTGLGLSVVRRLVADLGGALQVSTEPGAGTRFTIDLPCTDAEPALRDVG